MALDQSSLGELLDALRAGGPVTKGADLELRIPRLRQGSFSPSLLEPRSELDEHVGAFRDRSLGHAAFPYVVVDASYLKAHQSPHVVSKTVVIATACVPTAGARCSARPSVTPRTERSGPPSRAPCEPAGWVPSSW